MLAAVTAAANAAYQPKTVLPRIFAGWQLNGSEQVSTQPSAADQVYGDVLKEYGFEDFHSATYVRPDRKISVRAIRFKDATGAYGAFTFYKRPEMQIESIGDQGSSDNEKVLFYRGNILVDVTLDQITAMSAGELRELASDLPLPSGSARNLPLLPTYLPRQDYIRNTAKYVAGPLGLAQIEAPVRADLVDFPAGAEVVTGQYRSTEGVATLTLIAYPTPQIANARLHAIEAGMPLQEGSRDPKVRIASKRSGPIVAVLSGAMAPDDAKTLLASINYDANVTWNEPVPTGKNDPHSLLSSLVLLTLIVLGISLAAGIAFGGVRLLVKRLYPDRVFDRPEDIEIIRLNLR